jgi:hypothetical protein
VARIPKRFAIIVAVVEKRAQRTFIVEWCRINEHPETEISVDTEMHQPHFIILLVEASIPL